MSWSFCCIYFVFLFLLFIFVIPYVPQPFAQDSTFSAAALGRIRARLLCKLPAMPCTAPETQHPETFFSRQSTDAASTTMVAPAQSASALAIMATIARRACIYGSKHPPTEHACGMGANSSLDPSMTLYLANQLSQSRLATEHLNLL